MSPMRATAVAVRAVRTGRLGVRTHGRYAVEHAEASLGPTPYDEMPIKDVWTEYRRTSDQGIRNYLMEKYLPLVRYNAERIATRLPDEVDIQDLMSAGLFGLMDAIDAFDLDRGVKFETYCAPRIRGAILDELRAMDWVPRLVRHRTARVDQARQKFEMEHGREPTVEELARLLQLEGEEFDKFVRDSSAVSTFSLTRRCFQSDGSKDVREIDVIKDESQRNPFSDVQRKDIKDLITKGLSRAERLIVVLYYYEEMTMKEIGATLDLSESRVSQMHSSILARLKAQMQHRARELEPAE
jgi:RNA polymerase sigma factor for flagellar operon FliA